MTETENHDVNTEAVAPPVEEVSSSHDQTNELEVQDTVPDVKPSDDKEMNFKAMRESNARLQTQLDEERRNREYFQKFVEEKFVETSKQKDTQVPERDELDDLEEDDWTTKKQVTKLAEKQAKAIVQQQLAEWQKQQAQRELPDKVKAKHQDFEDVVNKENMEYLKANKPHIVAALAATKDPYMQALTAYDAIKAFCPSDQFRQEEAKMQKNASRPGTLGAAQAPSPLSEAKAMERGLTPDMKRKYQQEMVAAMRGS